MKPKTYRALRHDVVRKKQSENSNQVHHPNEKTKQVKSVWRFAFLVEKVKATEYTGVRNNAKNLFIPPSLQQKLF